MEAPASLCFYQAPPSAASAKFPAGENSSRIDFSWALCQLRYNTGGGNHFAPHWPTGFPFHNVPSTNAFLLSEAAMLYLHTLLFVLRPVISLNGFVTQAAKRWAVRLHNEEQAFNYSSSLSGRRGWNALDTASP